MTEEQLQHKREYNRQRYHAIKADPKKCRLYLMERRVYMRMRYRNDPEFRAKDNERSREYKLKRKQNESTILHPSGEL